MSNQLPLYKVVLVGDGEVGKTSLIRQYCESKFVESRVQTLGVDFQTKDITLENDEQVRLSIWDIAGQERFRSFRDQFYGGALGVALVFDLTSPASFLDLRHWQREVQDHVPGAPMLIVANKCDLPNIVPLGEAEGLSEQMSLPLVITSARTGENVETLFNELARIAHQYKQNQDLFNQMLNQQSK